MNEQSIITVQDLAKLNSEILAAFIIAFEEAKHGKALIFMARPVAEDDYWTALMMGMARLLPKVSSYDLVCFARGLMPLVISPKKIDKLTDMLGGSANWMVFYK